jgi:hypothetical protein
VFFSSDDSTTPTGGGGGWPTKAYTVHHQRGKYGPHYQLLARAGAEWSGGRKDSYLLMYIKSLGSEEYILYIFSWYRRQLR